MNLSLGDETQQRRDADLAGVASERGFAGVNALVNNEAVLASKHPGAMEALELIGTKVIMIGWELIRLVRNFIGLNEWSDNQPISLLPSYRADAGFQQNFQTFLSRILTSLTKKGLKSNCLKSMKSIIWCC